MRKTILYSHSIAWFIYLPFTTLLVYKDILQYHISEPPYEYNICAIIMIFLLCKEWGPLQFENMTRYVCLKPWFQFFSKFDDSYKWSMRIQQKFGRKFWKTFLNLPNVVIKWQMVQTSYALLHIRNLCIILIIM